MKIIFGAFSNEVAMVSKVQPMMPPLAIYLLSSILNEDNKVEVIDPYNLMFDNDEDLDSQIISKFRSKIEKDTILCFSVNSFNWAITKIACQVIKEKFDVTIIVGGLHASYFYDYIMKNTQVDYIVRGEGEKILPELISRITTHQGYKDLIGVSYREEGKIIHNRGFPIVDISNQDYSYPLPLYSQLPKGIYSEVPLETSRGCYYGCAFCSILFKHKRREYSMSQIESQVNYIDSNRSYFNNLSLVNITDDCFTANTERVTEVVNLFKGKTADLKYFIEARITDLLSNNTIDIINTRQLNGFQIGVECGYDKGLLKIHKGITVAQLYECSKLLYQVGLTPKCVYSFIIGFPWETEDEINQTLETINQLCIQYDINVSLSWLLLLPSEIWDNRDQYNINIDESLFDNINWFLRKDEFCKMHPRISQEEFYRIEKKILKMQCLGFHIHHVAPNFSNNSNR